MRTRPAFRRRLLAPALRTAVAAALLPWAAPGGAVTFYTWLGGSPVGASSWANVLNWAALSRPVSSPDTALLFPNAFALSTNDLGENFQFNQLSAFASGSAVRVGVITGQSLAPSGANAQIAVGNGGLLTINAALVGGTAWSKQGAGELALGGVNAGASGAVTVAAGRLSALSSSSLGTGLVTVAGGASLRTAGTQVFAGIAGSGTWEADGSATLGVATGERVFTGNVSGTAALTKTGAGRQALTGVVSLANAVSVAGGQLARVGAAARITGSTSVTVSNDATALLSDGSRWTAVGTANVSGSAGNTASLTLLSGSSFEALAGQVGRLANERGVVVVGGTDARFAISGGLTVGGQGIGNVQVSSGGSVSAQSLALGEAGPLSDGAFELFEGSATVQQGATIGAGGRGRLSVGQASSFTAATAVLGNAALSSGTVSVVGAGSRWTSGTLSIGGAGSGSFGAGAAVVNSGNTALGVLAGGTGAATAGDGTQWTVGGSLTVGHGGIGDLQLLSGAALTSDAATLGLLAGSRGAVTLDGGATWNNAGALVVGATGRGTLTVTGGSTLNSGAATVGVVREAGPAPFINRAQVAGGTWNVDGTLTVADRGVGAVTLSNAGQLLSKGAVLGRAEGSDGSLAIDAGSLTTTWTNNGSLLIGGAGLATVNLSGLAVVDTGTTSLGGVGGAGALQLDRDGNLLPVMTVNGTLTVGQGGSGTVLINGGRLISGAAAIGTSTTGSGVVSLLGSQPNEARWTVDGGLTVGALAPGRLQVGSSTTWGEVRVADTMSIRATSRVELRRGLLSVGDIGPNVGGVLDWTGGTLAITGPQGATLGSTSYLGRVLHLQGDQALEVTNTLVVGTGTIVLSDAAQVRAGTLSLAGGQVVGTTPLDITGTRIVGHGVIANRVSSGGTASGVHAQGGTLIVGDANVADGYLNPGPSSAGLDSRLVLASASAVRLGNRSGVGSGGVLATFNGAVLGTGDTFIGDPGSRVEGRFTNHGIVFGLQGGAPLVFDDDVDGNGQFLGNVRFNQRYTPGAGARLERLDLASSATLVLGGVGAMPMAGAPLLEAALAVLDGTLELSFDAGFVPGFQPQEFLLVGWALGHIGVFDQLRVTGPADGWVTQLNYGDTGLSVSVSVVPEPASWLLMLGGAAMLLARRRLGGGRTSAN